ncbi:MAG: c-type cytochrome biogenesis protein CcmI [Hyphomicrobiales bacterium]
MILWLIFGLMTAAAIAAVLLPLVRNRAEGPSGNEIAVYRDQLDELDRDAAASLIGKSEAEAARAEISRRLLAAADAATAAPAPLDPVSAARIRRCVIAAALLLLPAGAGALYLRLGSPDLAAMPAGGAVQPEKQTQIENLVAKIEVHLQGNPKDGRGWEVLAPVYMQLGRYSDSVSAWRNTLTLLGESADREANLGEALMAEANGVVTVEAKAAFARAVTLDNTIVSARYYLGKAAEQDGKREEAAKIWRDLIAEAPAGAHWANDVRAALARIEQDSGASTDPTGAQTAGSNPPAAPPQHEGDAIQGMVDRLAERVKKSGADPEGWIMLTRSYLTLGEKEKAAAAISDARAALAGNEAMLQFFNEAVQKFKIDDVASRASAPPASPATTEERALVQDGSQTNEMIRGMVARLAERLKKDGSDLDGWQRLMRSYVVLGERDKALSAAADARQAIGGDHDKRRRFDDFVKSLGLDG